MPITYDDTLSFCTREEVMAQAGNLDLRNAADPGGATKPTDDEGENFAQKVTALVVAATDMAGARKVPPYSSHETFLGQVLADAAAVGTAFRLRWVIYLRTRKKADLEACDKLLAQWEVYMGKGTGQGSLSPGTGGLIGGAVGSAPGSTTNLVTHDVSKGYSTLAAGRARPVADLASPFELRRDD